VAYVPSFLHDVFISYRWSDNPSDVPWVTRFHRHLDTLLNRKAPPGTDGTSWDYSIFRDKSRIEGNAPLPESIAAAVKSSATLLVVMSETYAKRDSKWCEEERRLFHQATANQPDHDRRIFVVSISDVPFDRWPDQFGKPERNGYQFWDRDDGTGIVRPISTDFASDGRFPLVFERLADDLFTQLNRLLPSRKKWNIEGKPGHCFV
jgi:TIR domain-containing protein